MVKQIVKSFAMNLQVSMLFLLSMTISLVNGSASSGAWELVWSDEFNGNTVNESLWNILNNTSEGNPSTSNQIELYTRNNVFLDGSGHLVLRTKRENVTVQGIEFNITSGRVDSSLKANVSFAAGGRLEVSARLQNDAAYGLHTAHWLVGYDCWPKGGEIDIMECQSPHNAYNGELSGTNQVVSSNYHYGRECNNDTRHTTGTSVWPNAASPSAGNFTSDFTLFAVEWNSTTLQYFVNDTKVNTVWNNMPGWPESAPAVIPSWDMFLILSQAYMKHRPYGDPAEWVWNLGVEQLFDYVRVYKVA